MNSPKRQKYQTKKILLRTEDQRKNAMMTIADLPLDYEQPLQITIREMEDQRKLIQNSKFHAMLGDISNQKEWVGKKRSIDQWKVLMVSGHSIATKQGAEMVPGIEGEYCNLRESTASMSIKRMASLIEYVQAWGAMNDVRWSAKDEEF